LAWLIDAVVVAVPLSLLVTLLGIGASASEKVVRGHIVSSHPIISLAQQVLEAAIWVVFVAIYCGLMEGSYKGQTLGKRWTGIATVDSKTGSPIGFSRAALRAGGCAALLCLGLVPGLINGLWPLIDTQKRALHDMVIQSAVIDVSPKIQS